MILCNKKNLKYKILFLVIYALHFETISLHPVLQHHIAEGMRDGSETSYFNISQLFFINMSISVTVTPCLLPLLPYYESLMLNVCMLVYKVVTSSIIQHPCFKILLDG